MTAKSKLISVCAGGISVPSVKSITVSDHVKQAFITGDLTGLDEPGRVIGTALAVLVKNEPIAFRSIDSKSDVTRDIDHCTIWVISDLFVINGLCSGTGGITHDVITSVRYDPTFKVMGIIGRIAHVNLVSCFSIPAWDLSDLGADSNIITIDIGNIVLFEDSGIVGYFAVSISQGCGPGHRVRTDLSNGLKTSGRGVVLLSSPSLEDLTGRNGTCAGIVDDLFNFIRSIIRLDIHSRDFGAAVHEFNRKSGNF